MKQKIQELQNMEETSKSAGKGKIAIPTWSKGNRIRIRNTNTNGRNPKPKETEWKRIASDGKRYKQKEIESCLITRKTTAWQ